MSFEFGVRASGNRTGTLTLEFRSDEPQPPRLLRLRVDSAGIEPLEIRAGRGAGGAYELVIGNRAVAGGRQRQVAFGFAPNRFLPLISVERRSPSSLLAVAVRSEFERVLPLIARSNVIELCRRLDLLARARLSGSTWTSFTHELYPGPTGPAFNCSYAYPEVIH